MTAVIIPSTRKATGPAPGFVPLSVEKDFVRLLIRPLFPIRQEMVVLAGFDRTNRLTQWVEIAEGDAHRCPIRPDHWRSLIRGAGVSQAMLVHNHPSGVPNPSSADLRMTREAAHHLQFFAIDLIDHVILVANGHFSFASAGLL